MHDRDIKSIRFVGTLAFGLGVLLLLLTFLAVLLALFAGITATLAGLERGAGTAALGLVMSSSLMGCGAQLQRAGRLTSIDIENIRLIWTGLFLAMLICGIASIWLVPPLVGLCGLILFALIMVRSAVIRLSS
jgi:hypothetical protein